jgi:hypothetical protein
MTHINANDEWVSCSGIDPEITRLNCKPINDLKTIANFLGWNGYQGTSGWVCYGVDLETGEPTKFGQFKPQKPHKFEDGKTAKYLSPKTGYDAIALRMPDQLYWHRILGDSTAQIVVTEGVKKAAALLTCGIPTLALCGVEMGLLNKRSKLVPALARLAVEGRPVTLAFDMDMLTKGEVRNALKALGQKLVDAGCVVSVAIWDESSKGVDDLLVNGGSDCVKTAIAKAQTFDIWSESWGEDDGLDSDQLRKEVASRSQDFDIRTLLPMSLCNQIEAIAKVFNQSPATVASPLMSIAGSLLQVGTEIKLSATTNHTQPPIVWTALIGESDDGKSPILKMLTSPLEDLQGEAWDEYVVAKTTYEKELSDHEAKKEGALRPTLPPPMRRFVFGNFTQESIGGALLPYPSHGALILADELAAMLKGMGQFKAAGGNDRQEWLSLYDGGKIDVSRRTSEPIFIRKTCLPVVGGIQPVILRDAMGKLEHVDGFWPRFFYAKMRNSRMPCIEWGDEQPTNLNQTLSKAYKLLNRYQPISCELEPEARAVWAEWHDFTEDSRFDHEHPAKRTLFRKARARAARIALVIHCLKAAVSEEVEPSPLIKAETLHGAIKYTKWGLQQILSIYSDFGVTDSPEATRIAKFVEKFAEHGWLKTDRVTSWWTTKPKPNAEGTRRFMEQVVNLGYAVSNGREGRNYQIKVIRHGGNGGNGGELLSSLVSKDSSDPQYGGKSGGKLSGDGGKDDLDDRALSQSSDDSQVFHHIDGAFPPLFPPYRERLKDSQGDDSTGFSTISTTSLENKTSVEPAQSINPEEFEDEV